MPSSSSLPLDVCLLVLCLFMLFYLTLYLYDTHRFHHTIPSVLRCHCSRSYWWRRIPFLLHQVSHLMTTQIRLFSILCCIKVTLCQMPFFFLHSTFITPLNTNMNILLHPLVLFMLHPRFPEEPIGHELNEAACKVCLSLRIVILKYLV